MEGQVTAEYVALADAASAALREFGLHRVQTGDAPEPWFPNLLVKFINSTLREYRHSKIGLQKYTPMLAWACRNLLELDVLTKYALKSEANARCFIGHRLVDGIEIFRYAKDYQLFREPGSSTPAIDETMRAAEEQKKFEGISENKFLDVAGIAGQLQMAEEYRYMNKVASKLVHTAARYVSEIHVAIKEHVGVHGLKPAP